MGALIRISYDVVTPESAEQGDYAETGWVNEQGVPCEPDEHDREEGLTRVDLAVQLIGPFVEPSGGLGRGCDAVHNLRLLWYSDAEGDINYRTGAERRHSYHLDGFTDAEKLEIYQRITGKAR